MPILFIMLLYICIGNSSKITTNFLFMYKLIITPEEKAKFESFGLISSKPLEFFVSSPAEVCKILTRLSYLRPIITLQEVSVVNAEFVVSRFKTKDV